MGRVRSYAKAGLWTTGILTIAIARCLTRPLSPRPRRHAFTVWRNFGVSLLLIFAPGARACLSRHFDEEFYTGSDSALHAVGWIQAHYILIGHLEGRSPSSLFDGALYLELNPDVADCQLNPLLHFALFGQGEGREWRRPAVSDPIVPSCVITNQWIPNRPLVSVIVVSFNYGEYVREALNSVLSQTLKDVEVILVEGGSTDTASVQEMRRIEAERPAGVIFLYRDHPCPPGDNRNAGISLARGRYVCCLDADDLLHPTYLEAALFLAEAYGYDFVYPSVQSFEGSEEVWRVSDPRFPEILEANQISTVALFRKSAWTHVGGIRDWPRNAPHVPEDWDFWVRLVAHGFTGKSIRAPLMLYRVHRRSLTRSNVTSVAAQAAEIFNANQQLARRGGAAKPLVTVRDPWVNLNDRVVDGRPAIWLGLPFSTIGGAESLLATVTRGFNPDYRVVVTGDLELPDSMPSKWQPFEKVTPFVYDLAQLFAATAQRTDFLWRLLQIHDVRVLFLAGSAMIYELLPRLRAEFPHIAIVDQVFNDSVHLSSNRQYSEFIDVTIVPSENLRRHLIDQHHADPKAVVAIPHGIDLPEDSPSDNCLPGLRDGQVVISFFGRLSYEKGPEIFVKIADRLREFEELYFCMTGEGPERVATLELISKLDLNDRIYTPGFVPDVGPLRSATDIVVLPSWIDGMPLAVLEAQASGKPVVASRVGSLPSVIVDGETGFLCAPGDVDGFCDKIALLAREPEFRATMGIRARTRAQALFGAEPMLASYRAVVDELLESREEPRRIERLNSTSG